VPICAFLPPVQPWLRLKAASRLALLFLPCRRYTVHLVKALRDQPGTSKVMLLALEDRLSASADDPFEKHVRQQQTA
jgi:hypothetical protein